MLKGAIHILTSDATVRTKVGQNKAADKYKVYPGICPEPEQHPFLVLRITDAPDFAVSKNAVVNSREYSFDVYAYTKNYDDLEDLTDAIKNALDQGSGTHNGIDFDVIRYVTFSDGYDDVSQLYTRTIGFSAVTNED